MDVPCVVAVKHGGEQSRVAVGHGVVGHHRLDRPAALGGKPGDRALKHRCSEQAGVGAMALGVSQARVVIDHAVYVDVSGAAVADLL